MYRSVPMAGVPLADLASSTLVASTAPDTASSGVPVQASSRRSIHTAANSLASTAGLSTPETDPIADDFSRETRVETNAVQRSEPRPKSRSSTNTLQRTPVFDAASAPIDACITPTSEHEHTPNSSSVAGSTPALSETPPLVVHTDTGEPKAAVELDVRTESSKPTRFTTGESAVPTLIPTDSSSVGDLIATHHHPH